MDTAEKLRQMVQEALPELTVSGSSIGEASAQSIMEAVYEYAQTAIADRDTDRFVRCFRLYANLETLDEERSASVSTAIYHSFFCSFDANDRLALDFLFDLDPHIRESIRHPFIYPHTWLRTREIDPWGGESLQEMTIGKSARHIGRHVRQTTSIGDFGVVEIELVPSAKATGITFRNCLPEEDLCPLWVVESIIRGITSGLVHAVEPGKCITRLTINFLSYQSHDVDSRQLSYETAAEFAVDGCLEQAGLVAL